tara:strand:+ start:699 stop:1061 length:363 start_codon:yes stop_codon:yes gene_type:complete
MTTETEQKVKEKETLVEDKKKSFWTSEEKENCKAQYGCEIVVDNGSYSDVCTKNAPTDAFIVKYMHEERICFDLTRGSRTNIFDMYYDKVGLNLKSIDYGHGSIKPNLWGYVPPKSKKRK